MINAALKRLCTLHGKAAGRKSSPLKRAIAGPLAASTSRCIDCAVLAVSRLRPAPGAVERALRAVRRKGGTDREFVDGLVGFVYENIGYWPMARWLHPAHVLRLGLGDCKNQARLLRSLLEKCGFESELIVGIAHAEAESPDVHAWVRVVVDGAELMGDPTLSARAMGPAEYGALVGGLVDITPEYLLKDPSSALYGVGKLSHAESVSAVSSSRMVHT